MAMVGEELSPQSIPPPVPKSQTVFPLIVQWVMVGEELRQEIPPPEAFETKLTPPLPPSGSP